MFEQMMTKELPPLEKIAQWHPKSRRIRHALRGNFHKGDLYASLQPEPESSEEEIPEWAKGLAGFSTTSSTLGSSTLGGGEKKSKEGSGAEEEAASGEEKGEEKGEKRRASVGSAEVF
jgi:hypothetical protein